jgi:hypothetical protein
MRTSTGVLLLVLSAGAAGCGDSHPVMTPPPVPPRVPRPTIQVNGTVYDTAFRPLAGATVTVLDGPQAGVAVTADAQGEYLLTGEFNDVTRFRATHEGHLDSVQSLDTCVGCGHDGTMVYDVFVLALSGPSLDISGDYALTIVSASSCVGIPEEFRTRSFLATIASATTPWFTLPANTYFVGSVSGAALHGDNRYFEAAVAGDFVALELRGYELVEQVAPNTYLRFNGRAEASAGRALSSVSTSFQGRIDYCALNAPMGPVYSCGIGAVARVECQSTDHRLTIARR